MDVKVVELSIICEITQDIASLKFNNRLVRLEIKSEKMYLIRYKFEKVNID